MQITGNTAVDISLVISLVGITITIINFASGSKKSSTVDGEAMGRLKASLEYVRDLQKETKEKTTKVLDTVEKNHSNNEEFHRETDRRLYQLEYHRDNENKKKEDK